MANSCGADAEQNRKPRLRGQPVMNQQMQLGMSKLVYHRGRRSFVTLGKISVSQMGNCEFSVTLLRNTEKPQTTLRRAARTLGEQALGRKRKVLTQLHPMFRLKQVNSHIHVQVL